MNYIEDIRSNTNDPDFNVGTGWMAEAAAEGHHSLVV